MIPVLLEFLSRKGLCKDICGLLIRRDIIHLDFPRQDLLSDEMMMDFNMFGSCMKHKIFCNFNCRLVVTKDWESQL